MWIKLWWPPYMKSSRIGAKQVFTIMETTLRHIENKAIGDSQHGFTKGRIAPDKSGDLQQHYGIGG